MNPSTEQWKLLLSSVLSAAVFAIPSISKPLVYGLALADRGLRAIAEDRYLRNGLNIHKGRVTNKPVAEALGYEAYAPESVLNVA